MALEHRLGRREFLTLAGGTALGVAAAACSSSSSSRARATNGSGTTAPIPGGAPLPAPGDAPFDTVVVMMMENRSFDHFLGWLPGSDGRQAGLSFPDRSGALHPTHALAPDFQGCKWHDPKHDAVSVAQQYHGGACDGWLLTQPAGDTFPVGYYTANDLPILAALTRGHTALDRYFCSVLGPTGPNRLYAWSGTTDSLGFDGVLQKNGPRPSGIELAIWDRLRDAGVHGGYYAGVEPNSYQYKSKKYDSITYPHAQFFDDAARGKLPSVTWIDPDLDTYGEFAGTSNDDHPFNDVRQGEVFIAKVYDALAKSPQWSRMVFVLTYDEHGGFYDHVAPPVVADDTVLTVPGPHPDLKRLGFRVPCVVMGPFGASRVVHAGPFEHCSILRMIEWRWGLEPMTARDRHAKNLAEVLDFSHRRAPVALPAFAPPAPRQCAKGDVAYRVAHGGL